MSKPIKITFNCIKCSNEYTTTIAALKYRDYYKGEHICMRCLIKLRESSALFDAIPVEFHYQIFTNQIDFDIAVKYLKSVFSKVIIKYDCRLCKQNCLLRWNKFIARKHHKFDNLCYQCLNKQIQNNPVTLELNKSASRLLWLDQNYKLKCLKAFALHNKRMQENPDYAFKHRRRSRSVSGRVLINNQFINFDSAYELIFLWHIKDKCKAIRRCNFAIAYDNHFYHPDFFMIDHNNVRSIVEIKGFYQNNVNEKRRAAEAYITETGVADLYFIYDTEALSHDGILRKVGSRYMWKQIEEINNATTVTFTDQKHREIATIGYRRFRKKNKDKEHII